MKKLVYGFIVFIMGFIFVMLIGTVYDNGSTGPVNSGTVNNGLMLLIATILFLCATITVCTLKIVEALKKIGSK